MFDWIDEGKLFISNPDADGNETYFYVKELRFYNKSIMMIGAEAPTLEELCDNLYEDYYVGVPLHENDDDDYFEIIDEDGYINRFEADNELKLEFEEGKIYGCPDSELSEEMFCKILSISPFRGKYAVIYVIGRSLSEIKYAEDHQDYENDVLEDLSVLPWEIGPGIDFPINVFKVGSVVFVCIFDQWKQLLDFFSQFFEGSRMLQPFLFFAFLFIEGDIIDIVL